MLRPAPFEPLPAETRALRLRAVRDGLIITGWLFLGFIFVVAMPIVRSLGYDSVAYWAVDLSNPYGSSVANTYAVGAFRYLPPMLLVFAPLGSLAWWQFTVFWLAVMIGSLVWLGGRWTLIALALPVTVIELYHSNINLLLGVAFALGLRYPAVWVFVLLTKITPGVGLLWFAVRREWRALTIALGATAAIAAGSLVIAPEHWWAWYEATTSAVDAPQAFTIPPPLPVRLLLGAGLVIWGARTDRPWTVPIAATISLPILWPAGLTAAFGAIPFLQGGDRLANHPGWRETVSARSYSMVLGVSLFVGLLLAILFGGPLEQFINNSSASLDPYGHRP